MSGTEGRPEAPTPAPRVRVSVIIPTYNWSAALRYAIRSVLLQTVQDFEVLVVGDGCTDDSEAVVAAFGDPRLRWFNLERNHGSQWAANNLALAHARADWVAYLGHDDIWYPTHLERVLATARDADVVTSCIMLYGPPRSGVLGIGGIFPTGAFRAGDFVPPSAVAHRRTLWPEAIVWRDPAELAVPMDAAFLNELAEDDHRFVSTGELTVFKFNAAWRRDSYLLRDIDEQEQMLRRIETGIDFRHEELTAALQSVASGLFQLIVQSTAGPGVGKGEVVARNRRFKGADPRFRSDERQRVDRTLRFDMADQSMPFEWHPLEWGSLRWTGPSPRATIDLPILFDRDLAFRICVCSLAGPDSADEIGLSVHDTPVAVRAVLENDEIILEAEIRRAEVQSRGRDFGITLDTGRVRRPIDMDRGGDARWLGIAVLWVELRPLQNTGAPVRT